MAQEAEPTPEKPKKSMLRILLLVLAALALVGVGVGAGLLYMKLTKPSDENPLAIVIERKVEGGGEPAKASDGKDGRGGPAPAGPTGKPVPSREQYTTSYFEFPGNFTTNMRGSRRFVQMSIGLATQYDKRVIENVQKHEVAIRAEVLAILADQAETEVVGLENRQRIQGLLRDAVNRVLTARTEFGGIENVYITALVMQ